MNMLSGLMRRAKRRGRERDRALSLYIAAVEQARRPGFYTECEVADNLDGRFDLIVLHVFLVVRALRGRPRRPPVHGEHLEGRHARVEAAVELELGRVQPPLVERRVRRAAPRARHHHARARLAALLVGINAQDIRLDVSSGSVELAAPIIAGTLDGAAPVATSTAASTS